MSPRLGEGTDEINADAARSVKPEAVRRALDAVRPGLIADGGNVELVSVAEDGTVRVRLQGTCATCPAAQMTRRLVLEPALRMSVPGVTSVLL